MDNTNKDELKPDKVDFYMYESEMSRAERHSKRWMYAFFVAFVVLVVSNIVWICYENQFVDELTVTQDVSDGNNNYIGNNEDITNGASEADGN